jgi:hypothetical protein
MKKKQKLTLLKSPHPGPVPPRKLGKDGVALWHAIMAEYAIDDAGGVAVLLLACEALDRAQACRQQIDRDGLVLRTRAGARDHPALKHELANRAFVVRTLHRLGLDVEAIKPIGRPPDKIGWSGGRDAD